MVILDENRNFMESYDEEDGRIEIQNIDVRIVYNVSREEESHYAVVREYPNGGKDVEKVIDVEEEGEWQVFYNDTGEECEYYDNDIPEDWSHDNPIVEPWSYMLYTPFTAEEKAENQRFLEEIEAQRALDERNAQLLSDLPQYQADIDEAICTLYELLEV